MSRDELSEELGISPHTLYNIEEGIVPFVTADKDNDEGWLSIDEFAAVLGVRPDDLSAKPRDQVRWTALGACIRSKREAQGISRLALASRLGLHYQTLARLEGGDGAPPHVVLRVCSEVGVTPDELLSEKHGTPYALNWLLDEALKALPLEAKATLLIQAYKSDINQSM